MSHFKIATWNVNSLRVRLDHLLKWINVQSPDIIALQETKIIDADFPAAPLYEAGYAAIFSGQKAYNGVAILTRKKATDIVMTIPHFEDVARRILAVTIENIRIVNLYVPNGQSVGSEKFLYKLQWLFNVKQFLEQELTRYPHMIVLGDFNIAPHERDVHDPKQWEGKVLFSEEERQAFEQILGLGLVDCFRKIVPDEKAYSWWDYRLYAFKRNLGLRIDHILASTALSADCVNCYIDKVPRGWERPSDHAPVIAELTIL